MSASRHASALRILQASDVAFESSSTQRSGWPTVATIDTIDGRERVALYVAKVGSHSRRAYEMRYQNPVQKDQRLIRSSAATFPLLLGFAQIDGQPICVGADAVKRSNNTNRFSVLFNRSILQTARTTGWAEYLSRDDERIIAFHASLLQAYLSYRKLGFEQSTSAISDALRAIGYQSDAVGEILERGRIATTRVIRDWRFSRDVVQAYHGRCAISGLNWQIVQAAHIFPATAPGSVDTVQNGLALSPGHHALFDRHRIHIDPVDFQVRFHPELFQHATANERQFLSLTSGSLTLPDSLQAHPLPEMLRKRYEFYGDAYSWAG